VSLENELSQEITKADIFLWALFRLGGAREFVDVEDVYVAAFELAPLRFCWRTRLDLPDLKKCSKALRDAEARKPPLLAKSSDRYKRQLTPEGFGWVEVNQARLEAELEDGASLRLVRNTQKTSDIRAREREKERLLGTAALQKIASGRASSVTPKDAEAFFRLNDYITGGARAAKIQRTLHMFDDDADLSEVVRLVAERVPREE